jgi:hypothetical protein
MSAAQVLEMPAAEFAVWQLRFKKEQAQNDRQ